MVTDTTDTNTTTAKRSPLHAPHVALGAEFGDPQLFAGWEQPLRYGDGAGEYRALRRGAGLLDLTCRGKVRLTGGERATFLDGLVTAHVAGLRPGTGTYAIVTTLKGRIFADVRVYALGDSLFLDVDPENLGRVLGHLRRYKVREDVAIVDESERWGLLWLHGPEAARTLAAALGEPVPDLAPDQTWRPRFAEAELLVAGSRYIGEVGFNIYVPVEQTAALWEALRAQGARPVGMAALRVTRVEAGTPRYGPELNESHFPAEANLEHAISYTKGCYLGQEFVSRLHHRGHVNRQLVGLVVKGKTPPQFGDPIAHEYKEVGQVTSAAWSPVLEKVVALGYLRREAAAPGTAVMVKIGQIPHPAEVAPLPFYRREDPA